MNDDKKPPNHRYITPDCCDSCCNSDYEGTRGATIVCTKYKCDTEEDCICDAYAAFK